jgi:hypothetical protein
MKTIINEIINNGERKRNMYRNINIEIINENGEKRNQWHQSENNENNGERQYQYQ